MVYRSPALLRRQADLHAIGTWLLSELQRHDGWANFSDLRIPGIFSDELLLAADTMFGDRLITQTRLYGPLCWPCLKSNCADLE
jgi:hypothetical protein